MRGEGINVVNGIGDVNRRGLGEVKLRNVEKMISNDELHNGTFPTGCLKKGVKRAAYFKDWNKQCMFGGSQSI